MAKMYIHLYYDYLEAIEELTDAERGRLFTALLEYGKTGNEQKFSGNERYIYPMMRAQVDRDNLAYEKKAQANSEKGKLGGRPKKVKKAIAFCESQKSQEKDKEKDKEKEKHNVSPVLSCLSEENRQDRTDKTDKTDETDETDDWREHESIIKSNIDYSSFIKRNDIAFVDELIAIILDVITCDDSYIRIGKEEKRREVVKSRLLKLTHDHIVYVLDKFNKLEEPVTKRAQYLLTMLYNVSLEYESYYAQR